MTLCCALPRGWGPGQPHCSPDPAACWTLPLRWSKPKSRCELHSPLPGSFPGGHPQHWARTPGALPTPSLSLKGPGWPRPTQPRDFSAPFRRLPLPSSAILTLSSP